MSTPTLLDPKQILLGDGQRLDEEKRQDMFLKQQVIFGYTIPIIVDSLDTSEIEIGSGIVVEIGRRTFVLSAEHVVEKRPYLGFGRDPQFGVPCDPTPYIRRELNSRFDVGFLEVQNGSHHSACPFEAFSQIDPPAGVLVTIVGHPVDAPGSARDPMWSNSQKIGIVRTAHMAMPADIQEARYTFGYPTETLNLDGNTGVMKKSTGYATPKGFSGGGAWGLRDSSKAGGVLHPGNMVRLYGIDSAWSPKKRDAYCVPIRYWVRLLYDCYPDLRDLINSHYPAIEKVNLDN